MSASVRCEQFGPEVASYISLLEIWRLQMNLTNNQCTKLEQQIILNRGGLASKYKLVVI